MSDFQPKPCQFCQQEVSHEPLKGLEEYGVKVYFCHDCLAEYVYWTDGAEASSSVYRTYRDKMYRWTVTPQRDTAYLVHIKKPGVPGSRHNEDMHILKVFKSDFPNITPDNFIDKLSVYLVFL